jgi:hypothetical protein
MLKSHLTLIQNIKNGERTFSSLSEREFKEIYEESIVGGDLTILRMFTNLHTGMYDYDVRSPKWLDSEFEALQWTLTLNKTPNIIRWDSVYLDDGIKLTDKKHTKLLNAFKYWITATDNPLDNGGKTVITNKAIMSKVNDVIFFVNAILIHSVELKVAKHHLLHVDENFWFNILTKLALTGHKQSIYDFDIRTSKLLNDSVCNISDKEVKRFITDYPYLTNTLSSDDIRLNLNDRKKSCVWLFKQGYYGLRHKPCYQGNNRVLVKHLFDGKCLYDDSIMVGTHPELHIRPQAITNEFESVDNVDKSIQASNKFLNKHIAILKLIHTNIDKNDACTPHVIGDRISVKALGDIKNVKLKFTGRTRTLPVTFVFKLIEQCYEFTKESQDDLLDMCFNALLEARKMSTVGGSNKYKFTKRHTKYNEALHGHLPDTERGHWFQYEGIHGVSDEWIKKGIKQVNSFTNSTEHRHQKIRNNESLFDLFNVLQGAIQFLTGAIMARRKDELVKLKAYGNLVPNIDPFLITSEEYFLQEGNSDKKSKVQYSLQFKVKKSGVRGDNETVARPIPTSIAKFIWRLEQFNHKAEKSKLNNGKLSLFNNLHSKVCSLTRIGAHSFDRHLNNMCDYFETDKVLMDNGEYRRNYVREHQLRRFLAMAFFWSKGFHGMDALRWMLGHTNMEHLYHYITESETGEVLNGVKAGVLMSGVVDKNSVHADIANIDALRKLLAKELMGNETKDIEIMTPGEALNYYDSIDYSTVPHIRQIKKEQEFETEILIMLDKGTISLEPHFFTVKSEDGKQISTFNLVLQIKEID